MTPNQKNISSLLSEIQSLVYESNVTTDYAVFSRFAGHVHGFEVYIGRDKENHTEWLYQCSMIYLDKNSAIRRLRKLKDLLLHLTTKKELPIRTAI